MLLLTTEQVEHCLVRSRDLSCDQVLSGVSYQDRLFTLERSFPKTEKSWAIQIARQQYLDSKGSVMVLVVEEGDRYTIWSHNPEVIRQTQTDLQDCIVEQTDLVELVAQMRNVGGLAIKDRTYRLKTYKRCFVGEEAVSWLQERLALTRQDAVRLGQRLINEHWIHHVTDAHGFEDAYLFYRFYWDEES